MSLQGTQRSDVEVTVYPQGFDPILKNRKPGAIHFRGRRAQDDEPAVFRVQTSLELGGAGSFTISCKSRRDICDLIMDDDWIDIEFIEGGKRWHRMRGIIVGPGKRRSVGGAGATTVVYELFGYGFQYAWEKTPIWFNQYVGENVLNGAVLQAFAANEGLYGDVAKTTEALLVEMMGVLNGFGRSLWAMPSGMPGVRTASPFIDNVKFITDDYSNDPSRIALRANQFDPNGSGLWAYTQEWSDPLFCELFTEIRRRRRGRIEAESEIAEALPQDVDSRSVLRLEDSVMTAVLRDRPFPTFEAKGGILRSAWWALPTYELVPQDIYDEDVRRSGLERKNVFVFHPQIIQEIGPANLALSAPLLDPEDIRVHGVQLMQVESRYIIDRAQGDVLGMAQSQRNRLVDWYCLNPYFYNGSISLEHGRPDILPGRRIHITRHDGEETYYVEGVRDVWEAGRATKTSLDVTRGWKGDRNSFIEALTEKRGRFRVVDGAIPGSPIESFVPVGVLA